MNKNLKHLEQIAKLSTLNEWGLNSQTVLMIVTKKKGKK